MPQHEAIAASLQVVVRARGDARAAPRAEGDRQHEAVPRRRLRDEQRRQRQDSRSRPASATSSSSRRPATTAPRSARRSTRGTRSRDARAASSWSTATGGRRSTTTRSWRRSTRSRRRSPGTAARGAPGPDEAALDDWTAAQIADGRVVGWFQGRMEWGARALGNRSIVADPRRADMRDIINTRIKFRERFRPFAPSVARGSARRLLRRRRRPIRSCCRSIRCVPTSARSSRRSRTSTDRAGCRR